MENQNLNTIIIQAEGERLKKILAAIRGEKEGEFIDFSKIIPEPDGLYRGKEWNYEIEVKLDIEGISTLTFWRNHHWGCNEIADQKLTENHLEFATVRPVHKVIGALSEMFPDVVFEYTWCPVEFVDSEYRHETFVVQNRNILDHIEPVYPKIERSIPESDTEYDDDLPF